MSVRCLRHLVLLAVCVSTSAFAQDLVVETVQGQRLADWIVAAQSNPGYEGQGVWVVVRYNNPARTLEVCGRYRLEFDDVTQRAFELGACDPRSNATPLRLLSRAMLFETQSGPVPRPRTDIRVGAVVTLGGAETTGGRPEFESSTACVIQERVFERNTLNPDQPPFEFNPPDYALVPLDQDPGLQVQPAPHGWMISRTYVPGQPARGIRYEIRDRSGRVVLSDRVSKPLQCREAEAPQEAQRPPPPARPPEYRPAPAPRPVVMRNTRSSTVVFSLLGELNGIPSYPTETFTPPRGAALGLGLDVTWELPSWLLFSVKLSGGVGVAALGAASATGALALYLGPDWVLYVGPTGRLWGAAYGEVGAVTAADLVGTVGARFRYYRGAATDGEFIIQLTAAPWVDALWTVSVGIGFGSSR